jgi:hypothetical protein
VLCRNHLDFVVLDDGAPMSLRFDTWPEPPVQLERSPASNGSSPISSANTRR